MSSDFTRRLDDLLDAVPLATAQIKMIAFVMLHNVFQRLDVRSSEVGYVNIVANTRAVISIVVIAENIHLFSFSKRDLD